MAAHDNCDHPRDPKGRAWCRANGGPGSGAVWGSVPDTESTMRAARAGNIKGVAERTARTLRGEMPQPTRKRTGRTVTNPGPVQTRTRAIKAPHDLADVPHAFRHVIDWAWENDLPVRTGPTFNDNERTIVIESEHGWLTLIWRTSTPHGIHGSSWRSRGTSIAQKLMTVNDGLERLRG